MQAVIVIQNALAGQESLAMGKAILGKENEEPFLWEGRYRVGWKTVFQDQWDRRLNIQYSGGRKTQPKVFRLDDACSEELSKVFE